jgi:hypothetical protein
MKLFSLRGAHQSSHLPQQVIARSLALRGTTKQSHQGRDCHALWARNDTFFMVPKVPYFMLSVITLSVALILVGFVFLDSALPQAETKEVLQKGEESPSQTNPADTRLRNPFLLPPGIYFLSKDGVGPVRKDKASGTDTKLEEIETSPFKVRAILISDQIRLATIGSQIVAVGDKLNDETILEIKKDRVILGKGDRKRTLHLQQSPLQLTIEEKK